MLSTSGPASSQSSLSEHTHPTGELQDHLKDHQNTAQGSSLPAAWLFFKHQVGFVQASTPGNIHTDCIMLHNPLHWECDCDWQNGVFPNLKPLMTTDVQALLRAHGAAFRSGDTALHSTAWVNLNKVIKNAKYVYKTKAEVHFPDNDSKWAWQGFLCKLQEQQHHINASLIEEMTCFCFCFVFY